MRRSSGTPGQRERTKNL